MKKIEIDAVKLMREIRDRLSKRYAEDSAAQERDLGSIRRKYGIGILENKRK